MKKYLLILAVLLLGLLIFSGTTHGQNTNKSQSGKNKKGAGTNKPKETKTIDIKDFYDPNSPTAGFQDAVDYLKPGGGTIFVSPGTYKIRKSIVLFPGIYIVGSGEYSVIERADSCLQIKLASDGKEGDKEISVENTKGFVKGGEVTVFSNPFAGFNSTSAIIMEVKEKSLILDRSLRKNYLTSNSGRVMNFFCTFTCSRGENIRIENLVIDGKMKPGSDYRGDFIFSAIHFVHVHNIFMDKVIIRRYPGDGFSVQGGSNASITNCLAEYNLGNGFHPGTTLIGSTWTQNTGRYNGGDGLFFCYNVRYATVSDNHFYNNKGHGIGDLGQGGVYGDQMNVVSGNFCYNNGQSGIQCTPGGNNTIINNVCENNSRSEPGKWPAISLKDTHSSIIQGNRCCVSKPSPEESQQNHGIFLTGKCENNLITGNFISGYSTGIAGDNLELNTIIQNIQAEKHRPDPPKE